MKTPWVLVGALVALAGAWWLLGRGAGAPPSVSAPPLRPEGADRVGPELRAAPQGPGARGREGAYVLRGTVTLDGRPAAATLDVEALEGYDGLLEGRRPPAATMFDAMLRLGAPAARGPAREVVVAAGAFSIDGFARGVYRVRARDAQGRRAMGVAVLGALEEGPPLELRLAPHLERLEGVVRWSDGSPVSGQVAVEPTSGKPSAGFLEGDPVGPLDLDGAGRFVAEGLPSGPLVVRVRTAEGMLAVDRSARVPRSEPWVLTLERLAQTLKGHVVSSVGEVGISGARVLCVHSLGRGEDGDEGPGLQLMTAQSTLDGAFELAVVALPCKLIVFAEGYARLEHQARDDSPQRIVLSPLASIGGRVVAAQGGAPASGAIVRFEARGEIGQVVCGADGAFELANVPPPEAQVCVWGGGWVQASADPSQPPGRKVALTPGARQEIELLAVRSAPLEVRVLDAAGAPVQGAQIELVRFGPEGGAGGRPPWRAEPRASTDASGLARLADVPAESDLWLAVRSDRSDRVESGPHRAGRGPVEVRLGTARWVVVTVLQADDGTPVEGARLTWIARSGTGSSSSGGHRTDERGQARLGPVKEESYFVRVDASAGLARSEEIPVEVPAGSSGDLALTIRATREARVEGRVLFPDGSPAARVGLRLGSERTSRVGLPSVRTGARGEFVVGGLLPGEHVLTAEHSVGERAYRGTWRVQAGQRDLELRLEDVSAEWIHIAFEVLDPEGRPVEQAQVHLLDGFVNHGSVPVQQGRGWMRFKPDSPPAAALAAGRLVPWAMHARRSDGTRLPYGRVRGAPLTAEQRSVTLRLQPERVIEGRVLDVAGAPVAGAVLEIEPVTMWNGSNPSEPSVESDAQGRFRFGGLGEDPMRLKVRPPGDFLTPGSLEVVAGGPAPVVRLTRGSSARVKVLDADGRPLGGALVSVRPAGNAKTHEEHLALEALARRTARQVNTGADGVALLRGIDPSVDLSLSVAPPPTRNDLLPERAAAWRIADTEVRLKPGLEVRGVVRDGEGRPLPQAVVYVSDGAQGWSGHAVAADGTFRLTRLPPGPVALKAVAHRDQHIDPIAPPLVTVEAGRTDLVLVLAAPVTLVVEVEGDPPGEPQAQPVASHFSPVQLLAPYVVGGRAAPLGAQARRDGPRYVFEGLETRLVTIWVRPDAEGRYGLMFDVATDGGHVRVRRQPGRRIAGRVSAPQGAADLRVSAIGAELQVRVDGVIRPDGSYEILGLPPGRWYLDAGGRDANGWLSARGEADAGGTLDLTLEPVR